jgi:MOSC domain-containing protein YiiM
VQRTGRGGWYLRVLAEGRVAAGQAFSLRERPCPRRTVALANDLFYRRRDDPDALAGLASCPLLAPGWREEFRRRLDGEPKSGPRKRPVVPDEDAPAPH